MAEEAVEGLDDLRRLAAAYKDGDKVLRRQVGKTLREFGKPISVEVAEKASESFGARGGLRERIASARPGVVASLLGSEPKVSLSLRVKQGYALKAYDDTGVVRHPVFGHKVWVAQKFRPHAFTDALDEKAPEARERIAEAISQALEQIARSA